MSILHLLKRFQIYDGDTKLPERPRQLFFATSDIHGIGVFTNQEIDPWVCLGEFTGDAVMWDEFQKLYHNDTRYCCIPRDKSKPVIVAKQKRNWITYVNESARPNCKIRHGKLYTTVKLQRGAELLLYYGKHYPRNYKL